MSERYLEDHNGFFNKDMYEQTGEKWRPIDFKHNRLIIDNSRHERERFEHQQFVRTLRTKGQAIYYSANATSFVIGKGHQADSGS